MKPLAIFTLVRNEAAFLPFWLRHYRRTGADLYVLDHESDDGSVSPRESGTPFSARRVTNGTTDDAGWMLNLVQDTHAELGREYTRVAYAEVDEILVPDDPNTTLREYLDARPREVTLTATGYDVCDAPGAPRLVVGWAKSACEAHDPKFALECPACNGKNPVPLVRGTPLAGRRLKRNDRYDKTLISSVPLTWEVGFHRTTGRPQQAADPGLLLLHFHYADRELAWGRLQTRMRTKPPSPGDLGWQNKITDRTRFDDHFDAAVYGAGPMPSHLAGLVL